MNTDQKIIKNKVGLLNLADMLGSVSLRNLRAQADRVNVAHHSHESIQMAALWR